MGLRCCSSCSEVSSIRTGERRHGTPILVLLSESRLSHSSCLSCWVSSCSGARVKSDLDASGLTKHCSGPRADVLPSFHMTKPFHPQPRALSPAAAHLVLVRRHSPLSV